jgi:hypothetical protein
MLGKLKIRCTYSKNGCQEILLLDNLENHEKMCCFEKPFCDQCFCQQSVNHNCIESLLQSKQELIESYSEIENELKLAKDEISVLKAENESYLLTIQELSNIIEVRDMTIISNEVKVF